LGVRKGVSILIRGYATNKRLKTPVFGDYLGFYDSDEKVNTPVFVNTVGAA
jgi:hypothetical protein